MEGTLVPEWSHGGDSARLGSSFHDCLIGNKEISVVFNPLYFGGLRAIVTYIVFA